MIAALLTALFFGITPVCAGRAIRLIGALRANLGRLLIALVVLGSWAFTFGDGLGGPFAWFFAAGAIGFGMGGMAMFQALPRLGAPLASLIVESGAALTATVLAWLWLGDALGGVVIGFCLIVLTGVTVGLAPYIHRDRRHKDSVSGAMWALVAAIGQGISITISRKAILGMIAAGATPHAITAAFQRLLGGALVAGLLFLLFRRGVADRPFLRAPEIRGGGAGLASRPWFWVSLNALFGPILGVTCLIWALKSMPAGIVQTIAATAPLISVPFARWLEGHRPPVLYYLGAILSIAGLAGIYLAL
jgi:drug/metabolite transporter (DMT)-like permease